MIWKAENAISDTQDQLDDFHGELQIFKKELESHFTALPKRTNRSFFKVSRR